MTKLSINLKTFVYSIKNSLPVFLAASVSLSSSFSYAQGSEFRKQGTAPVPEIKRGESELPTITETKSNLGSDEILIQSLNHVVLYENAGLYDNCTKETTEGDAISLVGEFDEDFKAYLLDALSEEYLYQPLSIKRIAEINAQVRITNARVDDHVMMSYAPSGQKISSGKLCVVLDPLFIGKSVVKGDSGFDNNKMYAGVSAKSGDPLRLSSAYNEVAWLNRNPYRNATITFQPGENPATTNLLINVQGDKTWAGSLTVDNHGSLNTGRYRTIAGLSAGNLWGLDHVAAMNFIKTDEFHSYDGFGGYYLIPTPWKHEVATRVSYSGSSVEYQNGLFESDDRQMGVGFDYQIPLGHILSDGTIFRNEFDLSYDYKTIKNKLDYNNIRSSENVYDISQFTFGFSSDITHSSGKSDLMASLIVSPGGMTSNNNDQDIDAGRTGTAESKYSYAFLNFEHVQDLPQSYSLFGSLAGQYSAVRLPESEKFSAGGASTIRGYSNDVIGGDRGAALTMELRSPTKNTEALFGKDIGSPNNNIRGHLFYDAATARINDPQSIEASGTHFAHSVGFGLNYGISNAFNASLNFGLPLKDLKLENDTQLITFSFGAAL